MPVLLNKETNLAELFNEADAKRALAIKSHAIPLNDEEGNPVSADLDEVPNLIKQGYSHPSQNQLKSLVDYAKYSSTPEQVKTFLEGAAEGISFGTSPLVERGLGVNPEDISNRREINPGVHTAGQMTGLVGSYAIPVLGEARILTQLGEGAGKLAGEAIASKIGAGTLAKVGSKAAQFGAENALFQATDEASKLFASDPHQSAETALSNIGIAGAVGAVTGVPFGLVSPLWKAASESKLGNFLSALRDRANGSERFALPDSVEKLAQRTNIEIAPEIRAVLDENPYIKETWSELLESSNNTGVKARESWKKFHEDIGKAVVNSIGKVPEDIEALKTLNPYDAGVNIRDNLAADLRAKFGPLSEAFEARKIKYGDATIEDPMRSSIADKIGKFALEKDYGIISGTPEESLINKTVAALPKIDSLNKLKLLRTRVLEQANNQRLFNLSKGLRQIFDEAEGDIVENMIAKEHPLIKEGAASFSQEVQDKAVAEIQKFKAERAAWAEAKNVLEDLNDRLHVGRFEGPDTFIHALKEMNPEDILRRLTPKNDAGLLELISKEVPNLVNPIRDAYLQTVLKGAAEKAFPGQLINYKNFFKQIEKWTPQMKEFALPANTEARLNAIKTLIEKLPQELRPDTARTLDALWKHIPGTAMGIESAARHENPITGFLKGELLKYLGRDMPDAIKLSMLKFLGSNKPINSEGFKAMTEWAHKMIKGETNLSRGIEATLKAGQEVLPGKAFKQEKHREKLKEKVDEYSQNPASIMDIGGQSGHYIPDHNTAYVASVARVMQTLQQLRPDTGRLGPLDSERVPSKPEEATYNRALDIAEQPLVVLQSVKDGTLTPQDVHLLDQMYPALYQRMTQKMYSAISDHVANKGTIPYKTRLSMSLFLRQPLDSTMTPQAILAANNKAITQQQMPATTQARGQKIPNNALKKFPGMLQTGSQQREAEKLAQR